MADSLSFFHLPDTTIFHGVPNLPQGYTFGECRALVDDEEKLRHLKERLTGYYVNGLIGVGHPFIAAIMTCVGLEVLGQVIFGFDSKGESIQTNTILIYEMLDSSLSQALSAKFKNNYNRNRNIAGVTNDLTSSFASYAHVIRKGLRNSFTHNYRSLGVFLDDAQSIYLIINEDEGYVVLNPDVFKKSFVDCYEKCFAEIISGNNPGYRKEALKYFDLLLK
jgi:hypothetical protein